jgi:hypothetical protein
MIPHLRFSRTSRNLTGLNLLACLALPPREGSTETVYVSSLPPTIFPPTLSVGVRREKGGEERTASGCVDAPREWVAGVSVGLRDGIAQGSFRRLWIPAGW